MSSVSDPARLGGQAARQDVGRRPTVFAAALVFVGVLLALVGAGCGGGGRLGPKALSQEAKSLQSDAAEGALLAQDSYAGRTTGVYTREHSGELAQAASQTAAGLNSAKVTPALAGTLHRLTALAGRVTTALKRLPAASRAEQRTLGRSPAEETWAALDSA